MILKDSPSCASIIDSGAVYSSGGIALNTMVALNAMVELGGRDLKFGQKPKSALTFAINPTGGKINYTNP